MTIRDLGSIGEVVGAAATVATLIYLALQIRASVRAARADTRRTNQTDRMLSFSEIVESEEVALIFETGLADRKSLTSTERIRFDFLLSRIMGDAANLYADHRDGFESADMVDRHLFSVVPMLRTPGGLHYWSAWKSTFESAFRDKIDEALGSLSSNSSLEPAAQQGDEADAE